MDSPITPPVDITGQPNPLTADAPSLATAWGYNADAVANYIQQQRQQSYDAGLADPNTGLPTAQGVLGAGQSYANALMMGSTEPAFRGFRLPATTHLWDVPRTITAPTGAMAGEVARTEQFTPDVHAVHYHIPDDPRAYARYEYDPAHPDAVTVTDIMRGNQPVGTGGEILSDALQAKGLQPKSLTMDNITNRDTLRQIGMGVPVENTVLGNLIQNTAQHMGATAEGFTWIRNHVLDKPSIQVRLNYDQPKQMPVPVSWTGFQGFRDGEKHLQVQRLDAFDPYHMSDNPGYSWIDPTDVPSRWVPESQLRPMLNNK